MMADFGTGRWSAELEDLFLRVSGRFGRVEVRRRMRDYLRGLLGPVGRKNSWQLAEYAGHNGPHGLQHLLSRSRWDPDELRDDVQEYVAQGLGAPRQTMDAGHIVPRELPPGRREQLATAQWGVEELTWERPP